MNKIVTIFFATLFIFSGISTHAQMSEEAKIEYLIGLVKIISEGAKFIRNGKEYNREKAAEHLMTKYKSGKKHAGTAELFIENIASKSSVTGIEYSIKLADGKTVTAREFFTEELKKIENKR